MIKPPLEMRRKKKKKKKETKPEQSERERKGGKKAVFTAPVSLYVTLVDDTRLFWVVFFSAFVRVM